jgi:putative intracellular protease/amidase
MKRILIALTSHAALGDTGQTTGNDFSELTRSYFVFEQAGYPVELASIQGGEPPVVEASIKLDDPYTKRFYERAGTVAALRNTPRIADLRATDYQAIFFVGGHGAMWDFPRNAALRGLASAIYEQVGVVCSVGHGSAALVNIHLEGGRFLVEGHEVTSFTNEEEQAEKTAHIVSVLAGGQTRGTRGKVQESSQDANECRLVRTIGDRPESSIRDGHGRSGRRFTSGSEPRSSLLGLRLFP